MIAKALAVMLLTLMSACTTQSYQPGALDASSAATSFAARDVNDPALRSYMMAHGHASAASPVKEWNLADLTMVAFYYHPDLAIARAQAASAAAEAKLAGNGGPLKLTPLVQHHNKRLDGIATPWSLGFDVDIPLTSAGRRAAGVERADQQAAAAQLNVGSVAWQVRSRVRARLLDLDAAQFAARSLAAETRERSTLVALIERRLQAGAVAAPELSAARIALSEAASQLAAANATEQQAVGQLAAALGVAPTALNSLRFSFTAFDAVADAPQEADARREALTNRLDLRRALLDYAVADATVKLEVARQYPDFTLRPGYLWDQSYGVWSLALDLLLPADSAAAIRVVQAQREVAAELALAKQASVITEVQTALAAYAQAAAGARAAIDVSRMQGVRSGQGKKQFAAGYADRMELTQARLDAARIERNAQAVQIETQRLLGRLEDALQRPLTGGPLPAFADADAPPGPIRQASSAP